MERHIIRIKDIDIHYRKTGQGPILFLLHPSPRSSKVFEPFMNFLSDQFTVFAFDLPGYGFSDALPVAPISLQDYLPILDGFFSAFSVKKFNIYGSATGAQLAIAYGKVYPQKVNYLFLDNAAHFEDAQKAAIIQDYFPDFSPQVDGFHALKIWNHIKDSFLFFPWFDYKNGKKLSNGLPPAQIMNEVLIDYLLSGKNWDSAYRLAFEHEKGENVVSLECKTIVFKWLGGIMLNFVEQLLAFDLPQNIEVKEISAMPQLRYEEMKHTFLNKIS